MPTPIGAWLRAFADRIMGRTSKPAPRAPAPPMAMDAPQKDLDPLAEVKRIIGDAKPPDVPRAAQRPRLDGSRRKGPPRR